MQIMILRRDFLNLTNNTVFGKTLENGRKHIKLLTTEARMNYLVSEPNYHTTKIFTSNLVAIEIKRTRIRINKPVYLELSML